MRSRVESGVREVCARSARGVREVCESGKKSSQIPTVMCKYGRVNFTVTNSKAFHHAVDLL